MDSVEPHYKASSRTISITRRFVLCGSFLFATTGTIGEEPERSESRNGRSGTTGNLGKKTEQLERPTKRPNSWNDRQAWKKKTEQLKELLYDPDDCCTQ